MATVVKSVYDKYKVIGSNPIQADQDLDDFLKLKKNDIAINVLKETISLYGIYSAWTLRNKTHNEAPWIETEQCDIIDDENYKLF